MTISPQDDGRPSAGLTLVAWPLMGRSFERWILGMVMAVLAFLVERRVLKALKRGSGVSR